MNVGRSRQLGKTKKQMEEAPLSAVFVWPVPRSIDYAKRLAASLGRGDLEIIPPEGIERLRGMRRKPIVTDHACDDHPRHMTARHWDMLEILKT
jgi:hypothetical protein